MSIIASELIARVTMQGVRETEAGLLGVGAAADSAGGRLGKLAAGGVLLAGAGLIALTAKVTDMAGNFESATETLVTGAGEQQSALDRVRQGILKTAVDTATGTKPLIDAMFLIESAGYRGAAGLTVLKDSAEEAKVGNADLGKVADVLTTVLHNYHLGVSQAVPVLNSFNKTVGDGKMYLDQLDEALTNVLPAAAAARVKFTDVEGALATMSESGDKGAAAGTHLSQMFLSLEKPTSAATKVLKEVGLTTQGISDEMQKSLPGAIQMIYDALAKKFPPGSAAFNAAAATIVGGTRQMKAWNELTGKSFDDLKQKTSDISAAYRRGGQDVSGWAAVQGEFNTKLDRAGEVLETLGIKAGTVLLPVLGKMLDNVTPLISRFSDWFVASGRMNTALGTLGTAMSTVGNVLGTVIGAFTDAGAKGDILRGALVALGTVFAEIKILQFAQGVAGTVMFLKDLIPAVWGSTWAFGALDIAMGPLALAIGAIALAVAGATYAFTHWSDIIKQNDQQVGTYLKDYQHTSQAINTQTEGIGGFFDRLGTGVKTAFESMHIGTLGSLKAMVDDTQQKSQQMKQNVEQSISGMVSGVQGEMAPLGGWMANQWGTMQRTSLSMSSQLSNDAIKNFDKLKSSALGDMSQLDDSAKGYWNDVAAYIAGHQITGQISYVAKGIAGVTNTSQTRMSAEGWFNSPGGWSWTGERGRELMYVPPGASIIPHQQSERMAAGGGSGQPVTIIVNVAGHRVAEAFLPDLVSAIRTHVGVKF